MNTCLQNLTGHPSVSVPAGTLPNGLPFGLLLTGPRFRDDLLLDLAARWEQARPWPWFAPDFEPLVPAPKQAPPTGPGASTRAGSAAGSFLA